MGGDRRHRGGRFALKVLLAEFRRNREEVGYLQHEHEVGAKLDIPQVITIYEFGIEHDNVYLAMELFPAPNLKQVIQQGRRSQWRRSLHR